jgi:hypothetical protein
VLQSIVFALNPMLEALEISRRTLDQIGEDVGKIKKLLADFLTVLMKKIREVVEK